MRSMFGQRTDRGPRDSERSGSQVSRFPANTYAIHSVAAEAPSARRAHKGDLSEYFRNLGDRFSSLYSEYPEHGAINHTDVTCSAGKPQPHASATNADQPVPPERAKRKRFVIATQERNRIGPYPIAACAVTIGTTRPPSSRWSVERLEFVELDERRRCVRRYDTNVDGVVNDPVD